MKPLHVGLLIVGAALAGGLAVKMTDLQPVPSMQVASPAVLPVPARKTAPARQPAVEEALPPKPSPMPRAIAGAPAPVYVEPAHLEPTHPDPTHVDPTHVDPVRVDPVRVQRVHVQSVHTEPPHIEPAHIEPHHTEQPHAEQILPKSKPVVIAKAPPPPLLLPVPYEPPPQGAPPQPEPQAAPEPPPPAPQRQATLPAGMAIAVRLNEWLSSERAIAGDTFNASLCEPLIVNGLVIAERGAPARGRILGTQRAGRRSGMSSLDLELILVETADGQKVDISTAPWTKRGDIFYGAGIPAAFRGRPVNVPSETIIRFRLTSRVTIRERQL